MEHTIPPVFTEKRVGNTVGRVKMFMAALLLSLAGIGTAHAQCDDLDPSEFSFNVTMATTLNFEADWGYTGPGDYWQNYIVIKLTNTVTGQTLQYETGSMNFSQSGIPVGNYNYTVRSICTTGDTSEVLYSDNVTVTDCVRRGGTFAFDTNEISYLAGCDAPFTAPVLTDAPNPNYYMTRYESSDENIATVDEFGEVSFHGDGDVVISAISSAEGGYCDDTASYTIHVTVAKITINSLTITPACTGSDGAVSMDASINCTSTEIEYYLDDDNDNPSYDGQFTGLTPGTHKLTAEYVHNAGVTLDTIITIPNKISITMEGDSVTACSVSPSVELKAIATNGTRPYSYNWNSSGASSDSTYTINTGYTTPSLTVNDNSGCTATYVATINWIDIIDDGDIEELSFCEGSASYSWNGETITLDDSHCDNGYYIYRDTVDGGGTTCSSVKELHLTLIPQETEEMYVIEWGASYTWPVTDETFLGDMGSYHTMDGDCPVSVSQGSGYSITRDGLATNGCDSIYTLNLKILNGVPVPVSGTTDTTLVSLALGDTLWVYDNGGNLYTYDTASDGILVVHAPNGMTLQVQVMDMNMGDGSRVYFTDGDEFDENQYFENNGDLNDSVLASTTGDWRIQFDAGDNPTQGQGFKLAITPKCNLTITADDVTACTTTASAELAVVPGGSAPYTFSWNNGAGTDSIYTVTNTTLTAIPVTITDGNGCTATDTVHINWVSITEGDEIEDIYIECGNTTSYNWNGHTYTLSDTYLEGDYYVYHDTVEVAGSCAQAVELHITKNSNSFNEEYVIEWGASYTWASDSTAYTVSSGAYHTMDGDCPVTMGSGGYTNNRTDENGCTIQDKLNLVILNGIPVPVTGTTDTTASSLTIGDTMWVYDNGGNMYTYDTASDGTLIVRAEDGLTLQLLVKDMNMGDGSKVYFTDGDEFDENQYFENDGDLNDTLFTSTTGVIRIKFDAGDTPTQGQGFKLGITPKCNLTLTIIGDSTSACSSGSGAELAVVPGGTAPYIYDWNGGDGSDSTYTATNTAITAIPVYVTDGNGCTARDTAHIAWVNYVESDNIDEHSLCEGGTYSWNTLTISFSDADAADHLDGNYYIYYDTVAGADCPTVHELHLTKLNNETGEEYVVEWGTSYTWPVNGSTYTESMGGYQTMNGNCPVTVDHGTDAAQITRTGIASNGCDSIISLNLTLIDGIPVPANGTTDTTLSTLAEGDTVWVYDNGGMMYNYDINGDGILVLRAPEGYALTVTLSDMSMGTGSRLYVTEEENFNSSWYFGDGDNRTYFQSHSGIIKLKYDGGDSPTLGKGYKLAATIKSLDDTCLAIYNLDYNSEVFGEETLSWQHTGRSIGYRVQVGFETYENSNYTPLYDTIVTDTTITLSGNWTKRYDGYYPVEIRAICAEGDTSTVYTSFMDNQCGLRPGLADGEIYSTPASLDFDNTEHGEGIFAMPNCWERIASTDIIDDDPYTFPYIYDIENGDIRMRFNANAGSDHYAIMPKIDTLYGSLDKWVLYFEANRQNTAESIQPCDTVPAKLIVGVTEGNNDPSYFHPIDTIDLKTDETSLHYVELSKYTGNGLYPYFMVPAGSGHEAWSIFVDNLVVIPNGGLTVPTNVAINKHPADTTKAIVSWTEPTWPNYDDDYSTEYEIHVNDITQGNTTTYTANYDATNTIIDVTAGHNYEIEIIYKVNSARYSRSWKISDDVRYTYSVPLYDRMQADTVGFGSTTPSYAADMPFLYGTLSSSEAIYLSSEVNATTIDAIAIRRRPGCNTTGSFQKITLRLADVENETFNVTNNGETYTITNGHEFYTEEQQLFQATYTPNTDGWIVFKLDTPFSHDQSKNLLVGFDTDPGDYAEQWGNPVEFYLDDSRTNTGLALKNQDLSSLSEEYTYNPITLRPQMIFIQNKNCTPEMHIDTVQVCENASTDWRDMTISFDDADINLHYVKDSVWDDDEWEWNYSYHWDYYDTIPDGAGTCDSVYKLVIEKLYLQRDGATEKWDYPGEYSSVNAYNATSCGPYTWIDGNTYTESTGYYWDDEGISGCGGYLKYASTLHYDTIEGGATNGCDRIALLNLTVTPYFSVIFDTTLADAGTGMAPQYVCDASSYDVPACTMTRRNYDFVGWLYDYDTLYVGYSEAITASVGDTINLVPVWELNCSGNDSVTNYEDFCVVNGSYNWHGHTVDFAYIRAHGYYNDGIMTGEDNDGIPYIYIDDTITGAVDGLCDSIYRLKLRMEDKIEVTDLAFEGSACPAGYTWSDGNHYSADTGYFVYTDPNDSDHYGYNLLDLHTAPYWIDSTANNGCGLLHTMMMAIDSDLVALNFYYVKGTVGTGLDTDTIYAISTQVCEGLDYTVSNMPDSIIREGYAFDYWTTATGDSIAAGTVIDEVNDSGETYYAVWRSTCSDTTVYDTITLCSNDTVEWHGFTWAGPTFTAGSIYDTIVRQVGVIPGECDSIFHLNIAVPDIPVLSIDSITSVTCPSGNDGQISVIDSLIVNPFDYNMTYQFKLDTSEYSSAANSPNYGWSYLMAGEHKVYVKDLCGLIDSITVTVTEPDPLTINIESYTDTAVCYNATGVKQFDASVTGGTGSYTYAWGNGITSTYDTCSVPINVPGNHTVSLTVTDEYGCTKTDSTHYTVFDTMTVTLNHGDTTYCLNATSVPITVTVTGGNTVSGYTYTWYDHNQDSYTAESLTVPTTTAGDYQYLGVTVSNSCGEKQLTFTVTVLDSIRLGAQMDDVSLCYGANIGQWEVNVNGGGAFTGQWYMNGTAVTDHDPGDADNKYTPRTDTAGTFVYSLKVTSNAGCGSDSVDVKTLTVFEPFAVTAHGSDTTYCLDAQADTLSVSITGLNEEGNTVITWQAISGTDTTNVNNDSPVNNNYVPPTSTAGTTLYRAIVNDVCGTDTVNVATITVYDRLVVTVDENTTSGYYCINSDADTLFAIITSGSGDYTYQWYKENRSTEGETHAIDGATAYYFQPQLDTVFFGSIYLQVTDNNGCGDTTILASIIDTYDSLRFNGNAFFVNGTPNEVCVGTEADTLSLRMTGGWGATYITWYVNGVATSDTAVIDATTLPIDFSTAGTYNYIVSMVSETGCGQDSMLVQTVTVADYYTAYFTAGSDSLQAANTPMDSITVCGLYPITLPENEYVYDGYTFTGWRDSNTLDTLQPGDTVTIPNNVVFVATWHENCQDVDSIDYRDICFGDTILWRGQTIDGSLQEYSDTVSGVVDGLCDSVYHLLVTVHYPTTSDTTIQACDSIWWNGTFYTETPDTTQSYLIAGGNQWGCDSTAYLNLTVVNSIHEYIVETACDSYTFNDVTYTESTDLPTIGDTAENGCPYITHISLTVNYSYHSEDSATACDMYIWNDMEMTESGDYNFESFTADGCDSIITLHLNLHNSTIGIDTQTACDSLVWIDDNIYFSDFTTEDQISYYMEGANQFGCDSTVILNLTMQDHIYVQFTSDFGGGYMDEEIAACVMKPLIVPECGYENGGYVFQYWLNYVGNDTVYPGDTLYLEESKTYYAIWAPLCENVIEFTDTALCEGSTFVWRGQDFTNQLFSGDYEDVAYGAIENWCDSIFYLRLTVYPTSRNEFYDSVTNVYIWHDQEYTASGDYELHTGYNRYGCDSTEVLHLIIYLGIDEKEDAVDVKVYPNPTSGIINIDGVEVRRVNVIDLVGRTVATFDAEHTIDIRDLPAGTYTLYIETTQGNTTRRIVKR